MTFEKLLQQSLLWRGFYFITLLLVNVILSRFLQADGAGWIYYITNFFSLILLVASLSMESGYTFFSSNNTISKHKLAWFSLLWTLMVALLTFLLVGYYFFKIKHLSADISNQYILYSITYICGILLMNFFTVLFYAQSNFFLPNLIMGILNLGLCAFIYFTATDINVYNKIVDAYFIVMLLQGIILALAFIVKNKSYSYTSFSLPNKNEVQQLLKYSLVALAGNLVFFFVYRIDYWFVRYNTNSCSAEDLGNYIQASKMGQLLLVIPQIMASAIFPQTASGAMRSNVNKSIVVLFRIFLIVFIVAILFVAFLGNWLFPFVFGNSFNNVTIPLILLLPGIFGIAVLVLLSAYFSGKGKVSINVKGAALALIVVVIGDVIFIPTYGIYAAALVSAVAYLVNLSYALWHFFRDYKLTFLQLFSFSKQDWFWAKNMLFNKK
jgi:O-antigen/teichoic acid export membrane protein